MLLYVTEIVKLSQTVRGGRFESSFFTLQGKPNTHVWGTTAPTRLFPFLSSLWIRGTPFDYRVRLLCSRMLRSSWTKSKRECKVIPLAGPIRYVLKLTDYHISCQVASTFKSLTKCATHRDLNQFSLCRQGMTTTQPHPLSLHCNSK